MGWVVNAYIWLISNWDKLLSVSVSIFAVFISIIAIRISRRIEKNQKKFSFLEQKRSLYNSLMDIQDFLSKRTGTFPSGKGSVFQEKLSLAFDELGILRSLVEVYFPKKLFSINDIGNDLKKVSNGQFEQIHEVIAKANSL